jgi:hypothetical protein
MLDRDGAEGRSAGPPTRPTRLSSDFAASADESIGKWFDPAFAEHVIDGLRKAGLSNAISG